MKLTKLRQFYPLLGLFLFLCMCSSGYDANQADWYNQEGQATEEDILGGLFGGDEPQEQAQTTDTNEPEPAYDSTQALDEPAATESSPKTDDTAKTSEGETQMPASAKKSPGASTKKPASTKKSPGASTKTPAQSDSSTTPSQPEGASLPISGQRSVIGHIPEFRSHIVREVKIAAQNRIELIVSSEVRIKTIQNAQWHAFSGAAVNVDDKRNLRIQEISSRTDANGNFRVVLEPASPYKYFSFVPFEKAGFTPSDYALPIDALELNTITISLRTDEGAWHTYRYTYQTYDLKSAIGPFVKKEIANNIKPVTIKIFDSDSRYPVKDAHVTLVGTPPTRLRLLAKYFKNLDLLKYALTVSPDYAVNATSITSNLAGAQFNVFYPYEYSVEISHPDYFFSQTRLPVNGDTEEVAIFLNRLYTNAKIVQSGTTY